MCHNAARWHCVVMCDHGQEVAAVEVGAVAEPPTMKSNGEGDEGRGKQDDIGVENIAFEMDSVRNVPTREQNNKDERPDSTPTDGTTVLKNATSSIANLALVYATKSTVHGLPSTVSHAYYKGQRQFWVLLVLVMSVALATALTLQLRSYYEWPTVINMQESRINAFDIPEVTVCRQELLGFSGEVSWEDGDATSHAYAFTEFWEYVRECGVTSTGQCMLDYLNSTEVTRLMRASLDRVWLKPLDDYYPKVVTDIYGGICNTFKTSVFLKDGAPYFNLNSATVPLDIVLAVKPSEFQRGQRYGLQVTLHTKDSPPFPRRYRIPVQEDKSCRIEYKKVKRRSLTTPYKSFIGEQCVDTTIPSFRNPLVRYDVYTKDTCMEECFVNFTIAQLGCRYYLHPGTEVMCMVSTTTIPEMKKVRFNFVDHKDTCDCPPPCEETQFEASVSCSPIYVPPFGLLHIELVSAVDMQTEITQNALYSIESMLGSLGGLIGLFMGFSLVSILEFIELIFIAVSWCCMCRKRRNT